MKGPTVHPHLPLVPPMVTCQAGDKKSRDVKDYILRLEPNSDTVACAGVCARDERLRTDQVAAVDILISPGDEGMFL